MSQTKTTENIISIADMEAYGLAPELVADLVKSEQEGKVISPSEDNINGAFYSACVCTIKPQAYVNRFVVYRNHLGLDRKGYLHIIRVAFYYMERLLSRANDKLSTTNFHRIFATSLLLAMKYWQDYGCDNKVFAKAAGISLQEMNRLEILMLMNIGFDFSVDTIKVFGYYGRKGRNAVLYKKQCEEDSALLNSIRRDREKEVRE